MKKSNITLIALSSIIISASIAHAQEVEELRSSPKSKAECANTNQTQACSTNAIKSHHRPIPPLPPLPPLPPAPPAPPAPPKAPSSPDAVSLPDQIDADSPLALTEPPPPPPAPPAPPELKVPPQAQLACQGKAEGAKVTWSANADEHYTGICVKSADGIFFEVQEHRISRSNRTNKK